MGGTGKMGKGAIANRSYLRRATEAAATKATTLYEMSKAYTPTKVLALEEHLEERLKGLEEKAQLLNCSTQVISRIDQKLDSMADQVEGIMTSQHANAQRAGDYVKEAGYFVTSNVSKSFTRTDSSSCPSVVTVKQRYNRWFQNMFSTSYKDSL